MRELPFVVEPGIGPGELPRRGSLADLVVKLPYVVTGEIPPRRVLNDVLRRGVLNAGMSGGCIWEPFEIDDADYRELVQELQRRGTRQHAGGDLEPFGVPDAPDSVRTYAEWVDYRYEQRLGSSPGPAIRAAEEDASTSYEEWLDRLPVADLYLGYLEALRSDWRALADDTFKLPAELVSKLRELAELIDQWLYGRGGLARSEYHQWLKKWGKQADQVRDEARACVDRLGLPRWPYKQFTVTRPEGSEPL